MEWTYGSAEGIEISRAANILRITFNGAGRRNALRDDAIQAFITALVTANNDEAVRAVLLTGANGDFCSGADIVVRNAPTTARPRVGAINRRLPSQAHRLIPLLLGVQIPVVAAVRGNAVGLGLQLVLASDFAVVAGSATLFEPFADRGMGPDSGASWLLPRIVGPVRARELLLLGRRLNGQEAQEWGIAYAAVPDDQVDGTAAHLAARLANGPTVALGLTRKLINDSHDVPLERHLGNEGFGMEIASRSLDFREGISAFRDKRDPEFSGL